MSSEETLAPTALPSEPIHVNDLCRNGMHKRTMKESDRRMFVRSGENAWFPIEKADG